MLRIDPSDAVPIWKQIEEGVLNLIATGALRPEDPVASVREMAKELRVNPLTVSKAYRRLADRGVLMVRRGEGTFVATDPPRLGDAERHEKLLDAARRYAISARNLRAQEDESVAVLREAWGSVGRAVPLSDGDGANGEESKEDEL